MPTFDVSSASPVQAKADALILPMFEGPELGPGVAEVAAALDADITAALRAHRVKGKLGETFSFPTFGRIRATSVVLVGLGPRRLAEMDRLGQW